MSSKQSPLLIQAVILMVKQINELEQLKTFFDWFQFEVSIGRISFNDIEYKEIEHEARQARERSVTD